MDIPTKKESPVINGYINPAAKYVPKASPITDIVRLTRCVCSWIDSLILFLLLLYVLTIVSVARGGGAAEEVVVVVVDNDVGDEDNDNEERNTHLHDCRFLLI